MTQCIISKSRYNINKQSARELHLHIPKLINTIQSLTHTQTNLYYHHRHNFYASLQQRQIKPWPHYFTLA